MVALSIEQQKEKLNHVTRMADQAAGSDNITMRLGAVVLYAGIVDFLCIQAARLVEQIVLKSQSVQGQTPTFQPHEDSYFYDRRVPTGRILKGIKQFLPFVEGSSGSSEKAAQVTERARTMVQHGMNFLRHRNRLLHQVGSRELALGEVPRLASEAMTSYRAFLDAHRAFMEAAAPYRFSQREMSRLYGSR